MGAVFSRSLKKAYATAQHAEGMYISDSGANQYLDMCGGAAVSCLGHGHPAVLDAMHKQLDRMAFAHTGFFTNEPQEQLAAMLAARFPEPGARVYFTSGGSEANETALKMAWQYWRTHGKPSKTKIISRRHSYHGNTLGALSVSGNPARRRPLEGLLTEWPRIEPCYAYRYQRPGESAEEYGVRAADALEAALLKAGPDTVAAFIAEPVVGASLGAVAATKGYFKRIREICDTYEVLLIADEVMCGTGRTGTFFAFEQDGVVPDIVTLAKGIGGGYQPLAATLASAKLVACFEGAASGFDHGHTYVGHALACTAGVAVLDTIEKQQLLGAVNLMGRKLRSGLSTAFGQHPRVGDIRGRGLFVGMELVRDRRSRTPLAGGATVAQQIKEAALRQGLMVYPSGGSEAEGIGSHILFAPPFILEAHHINACIEKLQLVFEELFDD